MSDDIRKYEEFEKLLTGAGGLADDELAGMMLLARGLAASGEAHRVQQTVPSTDFRAALRTKLVRESNQAVVIPLSVGARFRATVAVRNARMRRSFRTVAAVAAATMVMLVGSSLVAAAAGTVPGDSLYGIKRARENVALSAVFGRIPRAERQLDLARERLAELRTLVQRGEQDSHLYVGALEDMDSRTLSATELLITEFRKTGNNDLLRTLINFSGAQYQDLQALADSVPPGEAPKTRSSIELVEAVQNRVSAVLGGCPCPAQALVPATDVPAGTPGGVECSCKAKPSDSDGGSTTKPPSDDGKPADDGNGGSTGGSGGGDTPPKTGPLPEVDGTDLDNDVNDLLNGVLEDLGISPSPAPSLPPLP